METIRLIPIDQSNWIDIIFLTTNANGRATITEKFVASNALSLVQAQFEEGWVTKAIEVDGKIVGFTMYGFVPKYDFHEICRIMIDHRYQGHGYGPKALRLIIDEMVKKYGCQEIYLSTEPDNERGKKMYERLGFVNTGRILEQEELFCLTLN